MINYEAVEVARPGYVGGAWEAGGGAGFVVSRGSVLPYIKYGDNDAGRVQAIRACLSIEDQKLARNTWYFRLSGEYVPHLTRQFADHAPSRKTMFLGFEFWKELSTKERRELVRELRGKRRVRVPMEEYFEYLEDDEFFTGMIDGRTLSNDSLRERHKVDKLVTVSRNTDLYLAAKEMFGGIVLPAKPEDRYRDIHEVNSVRWTVEDPEEIGEISAHLVNSVRFPNGVRKYDPLD